MMTAPRFAFIFAAIACGEKNCEDVITETSHPSLSGGIGSPQKSSRRAGVSKPEMNCAAIRRLSAAVDFGGDRF